MDNPLEVRVLHRLADGDEELQPRACVEAMLIAIVGDRHAAAQLHDEIRPAGLLVRRVEHTRNVGMVHQRQRLPLGLKAGNDVPRIHAGLDKLERDLALDGLVLLGEENDAHAAFADRLDQPIRADRAAGDFGAQRGRRRPLHQEAGGMLVGGEQLLDTAAQRVIVATGLGQDRGA